MTINMNRMFNVQFDKLTPNNLCILIVKVDISLYFVVCMSEILLNPSLISTKFPTAFLLRMYALPGTKFSS